MLPCFGKTHPGSWSDMSDLEYTLHIDDFLGVVMANISLEAIQSSIELIKDVKALLVLQDPYLPVYSAIGGAIVGAMAGIVPTFINSWIKDRSHRKALSLQLYAEVKATLEIARARQYANGLRQTVSLLSSGKIQSHIYQIQIPDDRFPIYKNSLSNLGLLNIKLQVPIVSFYQTLEAIIQDVKPGGILNANPAGLIEFSEVLSLVEKAEQLGEEILNLISLDYRL